MTEYKTIREILEKLLINCEHMYLKKEEWVTEALTSIRKLILEAVGSDKAHSISHGDIIHPYETEHDAGYNQRGAEIRKKIEELTKE
jgi:hypothetical protein